MLKLYVGKGNCNLLKRKSKKARMDYDNPLDNVPDVSKD